MSTAVISRAIFRLDPLSRITTLYGHFGPRTLRPQDTSAPAGRNGEVKNCSSDTTFLQLLSGIQDLPRAAGRRPDQNPSKAKKQDYFKGVFF